MRNYKKSLHSPFMQGRLLIMVLILLAFSRQVLADPTNDKPKSGSGPQRIVSLGPIHTENIYLLGAEDRLIANTSYCVHPEAARLKEKVGSVMSFSVEKVLSLHPDLVLAGNLTPKASLQRLRDMGIPVFQFSQATSFADICEQFILLGRLLDLEAKAQKLVRRAQQQVRTIGEQIAALERPKVFLQVGSHPLAGAIGTSFTHDFIALGGGINISEGQHAAAINPEKVIAENPDVIIIAIMGSESGLAGEQKRNWQTVSVINAVKNDRVHVLDPDLVCSPSPVTFAHTLTLIAELIHPELRHLGSSQKTQGMLEIEHALKDETPAKMDDV